MVFVRPKELTSRERKKCVELDAQMNLTLSLSHYDGCPLLDNFFASVWGQAAELPWRGYLFRDLITQGFSTKGPVWNRGHGPH